MNFGSIFNNPLVQIGLQAALAAGTGGASLTLTAAMKTVMFEVGKQAIAQVGAEMGLPPAMIMAAQTALGGRLGVDGSALAKTGGNPMNELRTALREQGMSPLAEGVLMKAMEGGVEAARDLIGEMIDGINQDSAENIKGKEKGKGKGAPEGSILMQIAIILGGVLDDKMEQLKEAAEVLGDLGSDDSLTQTQKSKSGGFMGIGGKTTKTESFTPEGQSRFGEQSAKVQALGQQVGYIANALSTAIKSTGEGISTAARK